ncbi:MAG TPA: RsmE family RNA methyltransferase [Vicinamibacterales bacterium]|nr:RsmE family RNA methyltransferase [Vicinamibacterales bacterium]
MNVILFEPSEVGDGGRVKATGLRARHLLNVLKVPCGHQVRVGVIDGPMGVGTVTTVGPDSVTLDCVFDASTPERARVDLLLAMPRPKVLRRLWAQLSALGVGQVILTNAEKVERDYFDSHVTQDYCFRPLLIEGLQQARDTRMPRVSVHKRFTVLIEDDLDRLFPAGRRLVAQSGSGPFRSVLSPPVADRVLVAIGPEGGWNDFELALLERHGFVRAGLGSRTLTTTTACIAALSAVHDALADT